MSTMFKDAITSKNYYPFRMGYLTEWMVEKAKIELNETEEVIGPALEEMRKLIEEEPGLNVQTDDAYLLRYLRAKKFDVSRAFTLFKNFYILKGDYPDVYPSELDVTSLRGLIGEDVAGCLPYRAEDGSAIILYKIANWNTDIYPVTTAISTMTIMTMLCAEDPATQVCGVHIIIDVKGASLKQIKCFKPRYIQLFSRVLRSSFPMRFKGIHICNESPVFQYLWSVLKLFLSEKIKKRVHFYGDNMKRLQTFIPKSILPSDYGGDDCNFTLREWCKTEVEPFYEKYCDYHRFGYVTSMS